MSKLPPHACPNEYRRKFPHADWYHEGTIVNFSDGFRHYRGLVRGDGLLLSYDDQGEASAAEPRATIVREPCYVQQPSWGARFENWLLFRGQFPLTPTISTPTPAGNGSALFLRGETSDGWYRYV